MKDLTLRMLNNTDFFKLYSKLIRRRELSELERQGLLTIALILMSKGDKHTKELGYRIIVTYSNEYRDYLPLYDIATTKGFIPILKVIENTNEFKNQNSKHFFNIFVSAANELYKHKSYYLTQQQKNLQEDFNSIKHKTLAVIAPTSYGKSELILDFCNTEKNQNICIIVPTKALLAQTRRRLLHELNIENENRKILTHPEMYVIGDHVIAILTQERLLRLLRKDPDLIFNTVFVDEAHNLLDNDARSILLSKTIAILENRDHKTSFKFLTPFMAESENLKVRYTEYDVEELTIKETVKTERYYTIDINKCGSLFLYDQFVNKSFIISDKTYNNELAFIKSKLGLKNIVYINRPFNIEQFAREIIRDIKIIESKDIDEICSDISDFLHSDYILIDCIKRGFVFHHGAVPDIIRLYIEELFASDNSLFLLITSSTLLEGVNIPADKLFLLDYKKGRRKLTPSQFKNLSGRVCRFSEIFTNNKMMLNLLEPEIFIIGSKFMGKSYNLNNFLRNSVKADKEIKDELHNVLLKETIINDSNRQEKLKADEDLENINAGITDLEVNYARTEVGKLCFLNNITEISILDHEYSISRSLDLFSKYALDSPDHLIKCISAAFIPYISESHSDYYKLHRLYKAEAQKFYTMFLRWRMRSASYKEMINNFIKYWDKLQPGTLVYVGRWGEEIKFGHNNLWVNISSKSFKDKVNLAIVRIKEEQDFLDNTIIKFMEVLYELKLVEEDFYLQIKYGTSDRDKIVLIKNGISNTLASLLLRKYKQYLSIDVIANKVDIDFNIINDMQENNENNILIFEVGYNTARTN